MNKMLASVLNYLSKYVAEPRCKRRNPFSDRAAQLASEVSDLADYLEGKDAAMAAGLKDAASKLNEAADKLRLYVE